VFLPHEEDLREAIARIAKYLEDYRLKRAKRERADDDYS